MKRREVEIKKTSHMHAILNFKVVLSEKGFYLVARVIKMVQNCSICF